jgi:hypothetical protein
LRFWHCIDAIFEKGALIMKKFAQTAVLIAGLAGLSACASHGDDTYGDRTAGNKTMYSGQMDNTMTRATNAQMETLNMCLERESRLEEMNKACYRK